MSKLLPRIRPLGARARNGLYLAFYAIPLIRKAKVRTRSDAELCFGIFILHNAHITSNTSDSGVALYLYVQIMYKYMLIVCNMHISAAVYCTYSTNISGVSDVFCCAGHCL
jgi:hypothetical protein